MKKIIVLFLTFILLLQNTVYGENIEITSNAVVLMEASTGKNIFEKESEKKVFPASITKIMTLILIFDELKSGKIKLDDKVITSERAKNMGGSQVFLETGEEQTVETLIKCIVVASGNDASVAMAEHISGSEEEFVNKMNDRAKSLGMNSTHFVDCCGLTDSNDHYTSAKDVAIMTRELITKYPQIHKYSTIWMEDITHVTNKGSKKFGLTNTNKLLKQYKWTTGLKTGSTSKAKYCVSATALKDNMELIAVVMGAPDYKIRFKEANSLLTYGYSNYKIYKDIKNIPNCKIKNGVKENVACKMIDSFSCLMDKENVNNITSNILYNKDLSAPIKKEQMIGKIVYNSNGKIIGEIPIVSSEEVQESTYKNYIEKIFLEFII